MKEFVTPKGTILIIKRQCIILFIFQPAFFRYISIRGGCSQSMRVHSVTNWGIGIGMILWSFNTVRMEPLFSYEHAFCKCVSSFGNASWLAPKDQCRKTQNAPNVKTPPQKTNAKHNSTNTCNQHTKPRRGSTWLLVHNIHTYIYNSSSNYSHFHTEKNTKTHVKSAGNESISLLWKSKIIFPAAFEGDMWSFPGG